MTRVDIVNTLLAKFDRPWYLEIGTAQGWMFDQIKAHFKVGVDPDPRARCVSYRGESDAFFREIDLGPFKFDVVFVDGLHLAEQAWRDVRNAFTRLRHNGYVVMHDCLPMTWMHAGLTPYVPGAEWNGDVYRAAAALLAQPGVTGHTVDTDYGCCVLQYRGDHLPAELPVSITWDEYYANRRELLHVITPDEFKAKYGEAVSD